MDILIIGCLIVFVIINIINSNITKEQYRYYYQQMIISKNMEINRLAQDNKIYKEALFQSKINNLKIEDYEISQKMQERCNQWENEKGGINTPSKDFPNKRPSSVKNKG